MRHFNLNGDISTNFNDKGSTSKESNDKNAKKKWYNLQYTEFAFTTYFVLGEICKKFQVHLIIIFIGSWC